MSTPAPATSPLARLGGAQARLPGGASWSAWRAAALERLAALGLPTPRDDAWKYTNLRLLERRDLTPAAPRPLGADALARLPVPDGPRLVFVDGRYSAGLSDPTLPPGVGFTPFARRLAAEGPEALGARLAAEGGAVDERIRLLNACLAADGACLSIAAGVSVPEPIHVVHVASGGAGYPRSFVELGAHASATLIEYQLTLGDAESVAVAAMNISLGAGARLNHTSVQLSGTRSIVLDDTAVELASDAHYAHRHVALGGQLARLDLRVALAGRGASIDLSGLLLADGTRQLDVRTLVEHQATHTTSEQLYRGVASARGRGSYDGKVVVHAGAQKTDSRQSSRNLLIGREASIDARPQLEINADDVKCAHGATTGQLDEQMLFYLLSRGLDRETARALLTYAFMGDVITRLAPESLRRVVEARVLGALPAAALIREFIA
jgi:Fe-S cluster assembly protein SufD